MDGENTAAVASPQNGKPTAEESVEFSQLISTGVGESVVQEFTQERFEQFRTLLKKYWPTALTEKELFNLTRASLSYGMDPFLGEIMIVSGRLYVAQAGLLRVAHRMRDLEGIELYRIDKHPGQEEIWYRAEIWKKKHTKPFVGIGRASKTNVTNQFMHIWLEEMAQKRAVNRGLRLGYSIGIPSVEEMDMEPDIFNFVAKRVANEAVESEKNSVENTKKGTPKEEALGNESERERVEIKKAKIDGPPEIGEAEHSEPVEASSPEIKETKASDPSDDEETQTTKAKKEEIEESSVKEKTEEVVEPKSDPATKPETEEKVDTKPEEESEPEIKKAEENELADEDEMMEVAGEELESDSPKAALEKILETDVFTDKEKTAARDKLDEIGDDKVRQEKLFSYLESQASKRKQQRNR